MCIVGVAGFIGSHLLEKVIRERSWQVIGVDMVAPTKIQQLIGAEKKWATRFEFHQMNITKNVTELRALVERSDTVRSARGRPATRRRARAASRLRR